MIGGVKKRAEQNENLNVSQNVSPLQMNGNEYAVETSGLAVGYQGKALIRDISVGIRPGEIVTLIGPNGSGKSTILKSITKHLSTIAGTVSIGRDELGRLTYKELSKKVAVVLTERLKPELMTCRDIVASGRYPYTGHLGVLTEEDERLVSESMERVHVLDLALRDFQATSDGQKQRILLARAICQQPEIIVLDEPTSFLDIRHKVELLSLLREMAKERNTTVIMSLHEIDLAQKISDKIICVNGDHIAGYGSADEIFRDDFVQKLYQISEQTFNLAYGSVELPRVEGQPETFVISNCGSGIPIYRRLQKQGIPFYAGVLYSNDIDTQVARSLAVETVETPAFEEISEQAFERAAELLSQCKTVYIGALQIGSGNRRLEELVSLAKENSAINCIYALDKI